jgi:hypothetical protein
MCKLKAKPVPLLRMAASYTRRRAKAKQLSPREIRAHGAKRPQVMQRARLAYIKREGKRLIHLIIDSFSD